MEQLDSSSTPSTEEQATAAAQNTSPLRALICTVLFLTLAGVLFVYANMVVDYKGTNQNKGAYNAFYDLPDDYIDVAYIGSSATSRYFNNPLAYEQEGIASFEFGSPNTPAMFFDEIAREVQTTQHPDLYIFELRNLSRGAEALTEGAASITIDSLAKSSPNRKAMIEEYIERKQETGMSGSDDSLIDYYIPILRYHDRVITRDLTTEDFKLEEPYNIMGGFMTSRPTLTQAPQTPSVYTSEVGELDPSSQRDLEELLDFCDTLDAEVLFVLSPYSVVDLDTYATLNTIGQIVTERGYEFLNFNTPEMYETLGIDFSADFYNKNHVNFQGCEKYTTYFAKWLTEHYELEDHRGDAAYDDYYAKGLKAYEKYVSDGIKYVSDKDVADE